MVAPGQCDMTQHPTEKMFPLGAERRRSPRSELLLKIDYVDPAATRRDEG
jgi:hypothetical protein